MLKLLKIKIEGSLYGYPASKGTVAPLGNGKFEYEGELKDFPEEFRKFCNTKHGDYTSCAFFNSEIAVQFEWTALIGDYAGEEEAEVIMATIKKCVAVHPYAFVESLKRIVMPELWEVKI